jgi:outer membrane immunogenic protein
MNSPGETDDSKEDTAVTVRIALAAIGLTWFAVSGIPAAAHAGAAGADWSGPYVGLFAGHAWGDVEATSAFDRGSGFFFNFGGESYSVDGNGAFVGATAGHNWQGQTFVLGLEAELGYLGLRGSALDPNGFPFGIDDTTTSVSSDLYGGLFGRLGVALGSVLLYAKGGGAFLNARAQTVDSCVAPPASCGTQTLTMKGSRTALGWSAGGGAELALGSRWSVKTEYAYFDFGHVHAAGVSSGGERYTQSVDVRAHTVRLGLNYRW